LTSLAVTLLDHGRQHATHGVKAAVHVERDDLIEFLRRRFDAGLADRARPAGDIDENVDTTAINFLCFLCRHFALRGIGQIAGNDDGFAAGPAHVFGNRLDRRDIAPKQRQPRTFVSEGLGNGRTHPLGRSRDHGDAAGKLQIHGDTRNNVARTIPRAKGAVPRFTGERQVGGQTQNSFFGS